MKNKIKSLIRSILYFYYDKFFNKQNSIKLFWADKNFGDAVNTVIAKELFGKKPLRINPKYYKKENYMFIGSILQHANCNTIVWGSGFIMENQCCIEPPKKIYAVRGPKTRKILLDNNIDCPEVYGDPALLLPRIYNPKITKRYKLGIIPHYADQSNEWLQAFNHPNVLIIDILNDNPLKFIDDLLLCEKIASSSLHGIITADAYGIPSVWLKFSDNVIGGDFKFLDYFLSVKREDKEPLMMSKNIALEDIYNEFNDYKIDINLDLLLSVAPF